MIKSEVEVWCPVWSKRDHVSQMNGFNGKSELLKNSLQIKVLPFYAKKADAEILLGNLLCRRGAAFVCLSDDLDFYSCL